MQAMNFLFVTLISLSTFCFFSCNKEDLPIEENIPNEEDPETSPETSPEEDNDENTDNNTEENETILITVDEAGTLSELIDKNNLEAYKDLKISGHLNNHDILTLKLLPSLKKLDLENIENTELPDYAFAEHPTLMEIIFPKNLIKIPDFVCYKCASLNKIKYYENTKHIGQRAFLYCNLSGTLYITDNIESIGRGCFEGNILDTIIIGNGLTEIAPMAFSFNRSLKHLEFGENIEFFRSGCFNSCDSITGFIEFPSKTKIIEDGAFTSYNPLKFVEGIICKNPIPPVLEDRALPNYNYLKVPLNSKSLYEQSMYWSNFLVIEEF